MYKQFFALAFLSGYAALVAAQREVTLYDLSLIPEPTGLPEDLRNILAAAAAAGVGEVKATPVAVDPAGATYYVGVEEFSVVPTIVAGALTTVALPTPELFTCKYNLTSYSPAWVDHLPQSHSSLTLRALFTEERK